MQFNLQTSRLSIRHFKPEDANDLYEYLSDENVVKYEPYEVFTLDDAKIEAKLRSKTKDFYAVCLKDTGKLIGNIFLKKGDFDTWELGFVFNSAYQGMGYAYESAKALLNYVFEHKNARRIVAMCNPLNERSWHLLEHLGLRRESLLIKNIFFKRDDNGEPIWSDTYEYAILKEEWNK